MQEFFGEEKKKKQAYQTLNETNLQCIGAPKHLEQQPLRYV